MFPVRHKACNCRLFDSRIEVQPTSGTSPDVSVKCPRCSRDKKQVVLAQFRFKMPMRDAPIPPEPVYCSDLMCMARLMDLSLPYTLTDSPADISIMCPKCGEISYIKIGGIVDVQ